MNSGSKTSSAIALGSAVEKPLLKLHSAISTAALWRAVQSVVSTALPDSVVGLTLQHNPVQPAITKWTRSIPRPFFDTPHLREYLDSHPRCRFVRSSDVFTKQRLRAHLNLRQISSLGIARPHFLIECEGVTPRSSGRRKAGRLAHLAQLTRREQQIACLVCEGRSNQEVADEAKLSLAMVKKHLHSIFCKLEVPSRSRLMTLVR